MKFRPALVLFGALVILLIASAVPFEVRAGKTLVVKKFDLLAGLRARQPRPTVFAERLVRALRLARSLPAARRPVRLPDIPAADALGQPLELAKDHSLDAFFEALAGLPGGDAIVRIAYFGDSIVEGDLITQDLRARFQKTFGGSGAGYLPIASEVSPFRITVHHDFALEWRTVSILQRKREAEPGIAGLVFLPGCVQEEEAEPLCQAWVEYETSSRWRSLGDFKTLRVFYGRAEVPAALEWTADDGEPVSVGLEPGEEVRETRIEPAAPARKLRLTFRGRNAFSVFGTSWEGGPGVVIDNLALRGNSGLALREIPLSMLQAFNRLLGYKLIILHFGTNVTSAEQKEYSWYRAGMIRVVRHFQEAFPEASLLLIGAADRSVKDGTDYVTMPTLPALVEEQRKTAKATGVAFWDLFEAMGGTNAMVAWVGHKPPLAALDYTHLSAAGSRRVADLLFGALMARYRAFGGKDGR